MDMQWSPIVIVIVIVVVIVDDDVIIIVTPQYQGEAIVLGTSQNL